MPGSQLSEVSFFLPVAWLSIKHWAEDSEKTLGHGRVTNGNIWDFVITWMKAADQECLI